jgi:tetratricopeptide (TPR) repeat protein
MHRASFCIFISLLALGISPASSAGAGDVPLVQRQWFETRTAHFNIYSCGTPQEVNKVAGQLEEFCEAYSLLAGSQAVASPPIVVMAFPDHETMKPFLPLYHGQPENLAGLFQHGNDENLIVLSLPEAGAASMDMSVVFHEYTHLLFRRNDRIWPVWLKEGMAELYSTFAATGYNAFIGQPINHHLRLLAKQPLMPLAELFAVTHDSPQYNEREHQGMFYAESWLLAHFLVAGDNPDYKSRFGQFTALLREGQTPVQAFTNALQTPLPVVESELRRYLARGQFAPIQLTFPENVALPKAINTWNLTPVEVYFCLGDELLRINRLDAAEQYFTDAQKLAPASPLPYEGLGLLAIQRRQPDKAVRELKESLRFGSSSYIAHYFYALEKFRLAGDAQGGRGSLPKETAAEIHDELIKSIALMPDFGSSHELFGILELAQDGNSVVAEQHLQLAVQLEPENPYYLLALADVQARNKKPEAARQTLATLLLPSVEARIRAQANELLQQITGMNSAH